MSGNKKVIPYGKHSIDDQDVAAVVDVLENRFLTQGGLVPSFEEKLAGYTHSKYAVAVNSGTSGLHIACLAAGVSRGDMVWTVPNSFVASANCALYCGAEVDFVDIDAVTRNICPNALEEKLKSTKRLPKALIVVHFSGASCDMKRLRELTKVHGITLIEDAAHAMGGEYAGTKVGSCCYSDMTVLSFHPVKSMTTAEGGAVLTNDVGLAKRLKLFSSHGVTRDSALMEGPTHGPWYYQQVELGYNYRLSELHAALGLSQLNRLDDFILTRTQLANQYTNTLTELPLILPVVPDYSASAWHLYMVEVKEHDREIVYQALQARGVGVNVHYIPIHLQPYYQKLGFKAGDFPNAEKFYENAITIPLFPSMTADEQSKVIRALTEVLA